jgi:hypothetical protein
MRCFLSGCVRTMRGSFVGEGLNQRFVVQELLKYYEYWKEDDLYQDRIRTLWRAVVEEGTDPYCGAYREALRKLGDR